MRHHGAGLLRGGGSQSLLDQLLTDPATASLTNRDQAMIAYVVKLTSTPSSMREADIRLLREAGFSDRAILEIATVAAYFAFVNRIALGLGVQLETEFDEFTR